MKNCCHEHQQSLPCAQSSTSSRTCAIGSPSSVPARHRLQVSFYKPPSTACVGQEDGTGQALGRAGTSELRNGRSPLPPSVPPGRTPLVAPLLGAVGTCGRWGVPPNSANFNRGPTNTNSKQLPLLAGPDLQQNTANLIYLL